MSSSERCKASCTIEGYQEDEDEDMADDDQVEGKLSIQQILEGMTNEFNKAIKESDLKKAEPITAEHVEVRNEETAAQVEGDQPAVNNESNTETLTEPLNKDPNEREKSDPTPAVANNVADEEIAEKENGEGSEKEKDGLNKDKEDDGKKEGNIPRIVLTFRTIDEKTDHGKKTKISSCSSNLSLVPDELANCDQIGGVSVKIELPEEQSEKSDSEENKKGGKEKEKEVETKEEEKVKDEMEPVKEEEVKVETEMNEKVAPAEPPRLRKRRTGRFRLRNNSESFEDPPGPKRSARRLCKESIRSTVLESAIARKEKSNYTEESLHLKKQKKYSRPGRPKKVLAKTADSTDKTAQNSLTDLNNSVTDDSLQDSQNCTTEETNDHENKNSVDIEGMPKLSPKATADLSNSKFNHLGSPMSDDCATLNDQPFLKPVTARSRRERGKAKTNFAAKRITKSETLDVTSIAETKKSDSSDESSTPIKRTRRSLVPSPSPAEGQASKPESTALLNDAAKCSLLCLCQVRSQLYVTITGSGAPLYCTAIDSIDDRLVGCCNEVDSHDVAMRRPSTRVPFIILCRMHKERLLRHNCCPSCGLFCTQGRFVQCSNGHQYHRGCEIYLTKKSACPHCTCESQAQDILISMNGKRKPVYIPTRKKFSKLPSAKMSLPGKADNLQHEEIRPGPLIPPECITLPEPTISPDRPERFTIMSMYTAVKNGDLEKLVNVLACGYNANHTFRDYMHRTSLHVAADKGYLSCVHVLVQAGAQVDVMDRNQLTPLMLAASKGRTEVVKYLVRVGADIAIKGEDGMTALHMAAKEGHLEACRIILSECKVPRGFIDAVDDGGWTSLIWASEFCHVQVVRFLLDKKCDPLIRDAEQNIALHWSAFSGSSEITEMLLNEGCDVNAVNVHGDTPLHIAARQDQYAVSVLLLARGAKVNEVNAAGETVINCCPTEGDTMNALRLNAKINELSEHMWEKTTKILTNDVTRSKETNPIQCVNAVDLEDKPTDFVYVTENCFTSNIHVNRTITSLQSCRCEDNCSFDKCLCGTISVRCWYDEEGKLVPEFNYADPPMLFECNPACDCNRITCNNRVVQHGITQRFQLFRTEGKGWGVRTLRHIPKGTYVCEYVGEIISDSEADHREDDSYLFDLDNRVRLESLVKDGETYCIDARRFGNIARFINHSCAPNLLPVRVFVEHQDLHFPRIAFFANRDIESDEELSFDYGEKFWIIKCKSFTCNCGAEHCRYSAKTIQVTLDNYRRKIQQEEMQAAQLSSF